MTSPAEWDQCFAEWTQYCSPAFFSVHGARMRALERELRARLAHNDAEVSEWIGRQRPPIESGAFQVQQRVLSRVRVSYSTLAVDACLAFCPVTLVLTTTHTTLPRIDVELFRLPRPQDIMNSLLAHGLADDCNVGIDPLLLPAARVARIGLTELPALVTSMADAATAAIGVDGIVPCGLARPNEGMIHSVSIAGGRVIGTLLMPLLFFADDLGDLPDVLNGNLSAQNLDAFCEEASQALTVSLGRAAPVRIDFKVSAPALIFDALLEGTALHCETAAYCATRAAIAAGGADCTIVYGDTPDRTGGQALSIGFDPGRKVECNIRLFALGQEDIDRYTEAFVAGSSAAGISMVRTRVCPGGKAFFA